MENKIERGIVKTNLVPVLPKEPDCEGKQYTPHYSRMMDSAALIVCFKPVNQTCIEGISENWGHTDLVPEHASKVAVPYSVSYCLLLIITYRAFCAVIDTPQSQNSLLKCYCGGKAT